MNASAFLSRIYHRFITDSAEGLPEDLGAAINLLVIDVNIDISGGRDVGMPELGLGQLQVPAFLVDHGTGEVSERMKPRGSVAMVRVPSGHQRTVPARSLV